MKLSDAILLGSTLQQIDSSCWECCLLGVGVAALGQKNWMNREALRRWPWIEEQFEAPDCMVRHYTDYVKGDGTTIISCMAEWVQTGEITLEEAVEWIKSVEPSETPNVPSEAPAELVCVEAK